MYNYIYYVLSTVTRQLRNWREWIILRLLHTFHAIENLQIITHRFTYFHYTSYADLVILGLLVLLRISTFHYNIGLCVRQCELWLMRKTRTLSVRFRPFPKELSQLNNSTVYTTHYIPTALQWVIAMCTCDMLPCNLWQKTACKF